MVLIGWDGADWDIITPLLDAGRLPNLERLVEGGVMGDLVAPAPRLCPILWTTLLTGRSPQAHGILSEDEPCDLTGGRRRVPSSRRQVDAIWDILSRAGLGIHAVNWPASHPAEPINGVAVSERFSKVVGTSDEPWPLAPGTIVPDNYSEILEACRVHPGELDVASLLYFIPHAAEIDQVTDHRLELLATILAESASVHAAATWLAENEPSDLLAIRYGGIEQACRSFMRYHPPRRNEVTEREFEIYKQVVEGVYRFHDLMLGRLLDLLGPDVTVILVSEHGFHSGVLRPKERASLPESWHRPVGIFLGSGPPFKRDARIRNAGLLDIAPTILTLLGLPVDLALEGRPLREALVDHPSLDRVDSDQTATQPGRLAVEMPGKEPFHLELEAALAELRKQYSHDDQEMTTALGQRQQLHRQVRDYNLARWLFETGRVAEAAPILTSLNQEAPYETEFALLLANCHLQLGHLDKCRGLVNRSFDRPQDRPLADYFLARAALQDGEAQEALAFLHKAESGVGRSAELERVIGDAYMMLRRPFEAERAYRRAIEIDSDLLSGYQGLAAALLELGYASEAIEASRSAISLRHDDARSRYLLGLGLERLGTIEQSIESYETCVRLDPTFGDARKRLVTLRRRLSLDKSRIKAQKPQRLTT